MPKTLKELAEFLGGRVQGDGATALSGVASAESARVGDLVFVEEEKHLAVALAGAASGVLAGEFAGQHTLSLIHI